MRSSMLSWLALALLTGTARATDAFDLSKYTADGETTYCVLSAGGPRTSTYEGLTPTSAGKCPVAIKMFVAVKSYTMSSSIFDVTWTAATNLNRAGAEFPVQSIDGKLGVNSTAVFACKIGTACLGEDKIASALIMPRDQPSLDSSSDVTVELTSFRLTIPSKGDYVVIGDITIKTGLSGSNFKEKVTDSMVFQRVQASTDGVTPPGKISAGGSDASASTPSPTSSSSGSSSSLTRVAPELTVEKERTVVEAQEANGGLKSTTSSGTNGGTIALALVAAVGLVAAVLFIVYSRKRTQPQHDQTYTGSSSYGANSLASTDMTQPPPQPPIRMAQPSSPTQSVVPSFQNRPPPQPTGFRPYSNSLESLGVDSIRSGSDVSSRHSQENGFTNTSISFESSTNSAISFSSFASSQNSFMSSEVAAKPTTNKGIDNRMSVSELLQTSRTQASARETDIRESAWL